MKDHTKEAGCDWIVGYHSDHFTKEPTPEHCGKIRETGWSYCPKHVLFHLDAQEEKKRRSLKAIQTRNWNTIKKEALENSPLAAYNPAFDEDDQPKGYSQ